MIFSRTQIGVMKVFAGSIRARFSIRQVAGIAKKTYRLAYGSIKDLTVRGLLSKDERGLLSLNYRENHPALAYIESLRAGDFLEKNKTVALFAKDVKDRIGLDFFTLLAFGSCVSGKKKPRDIDILLIVPEKGDVEAAERVLERAASNFTLTFDCHVISTESAREMLAKRGEANVFNETLDKHILLFGAENYYLLLKNAG